HLFAPIGLDIGAKTPSEIAVSVVSELMAIYNKTSKKSLRDKSENLIIVRGAGDLASATILRLHNAGYRVLSLEIEKPTTIRRTVSYSTAMVRGEMSIEGVMCKRVESVEEAKSVMDNSMIAILHDPAGVSIKKLHPAVVVDAIIAKKNLGTTIDMAPLVIALGPGFIAKKDCHIVVETMRGHYLGTIIRQGSAIANTGEPGEIGGESVRRVLHSPYAGLFMSDKHIGDIVTIGEVIATVGEKEITATLSGVIRGLLANNIEIPVGFKIGDIDPRGDVKSCSTVSDKGRAIAGAVLEAVDAFHSGRAL
ncbi:MAG: EF2563 family selenium-dependent molybdenum hydroxylase system protein, partial [Spirochaetia bacterium]|nr:EF2563 family selenium-dependent molybdenum hydroxylase system protein [Spirochaetia bacterium]